MNILAVTIGGLGDAVLYSPVIRALRKRYPQSSIRLLVANRLAASAYAGASEIDSVAFLHPGSRNALQKSLGLLKFCIQSRMRNGSYDLGVYATGLNPKLPGLLRVLAGVHRSVCGPKPPAFPTDIECNVALARQFDSGISTADAFVPISDAAEEEAAQTLQAAGIHGGEALLAVYPSTNLSHRPRWPLTDLLEIVRRIKKRPFAGKIIVVGSHAEGREWSHADTDRLVDTNLCGRLSIAGSAAVLQRCCLTIGSDGGLMHIAGAVGSPAVVVMVNAPLSYRPPGSRTTVIHSQLDCCSATYPKRPDWCHDARCRQSVPFDEVWQACEAVLAEGSCSGMGKIG